MVDDPEALRGGPQTDRPGPHDETVRHEEVTGVDPDQLARVEEGDPDGVVGDEYIGTLANGGTDLAPYHDLAGVVPQSLQDEIDELRNDIIDGIVVPGA